MPDGAFSRTVREDGCRVENKSTSDGRFWLYLLIAVLVLACAFRAAGLDSESIWLDEAISIRISSQDWGEVIESALLEDVHPPLYYLVLKPFVTLGNSEVAARFPSLVFGVFAVGLTYIIGRETIGKERGITAAFLMAVSGFAIFYSQEARMYSMLSALVLATFYFYLMALRAGGWRNWGGVTAFALLSIYTHYFAIIPLTAIFIHFIYRWFNVRKTEAKIPTRHFVVSIALVVTGSLPLVASIFAGAAEKVNIFDLPVDVGGYIAEYLAKTSGSMFPMANYDGLTDTWTLNPAVFILSMAMAALVVLGILSIYRRRGINASVLLLWLIVPLAFGLVLVHLINFHQRYMLFALTPYLLFAAEGIWWLGGLPEKLSRPPLKKYRRKKDARRMRKDADENPRVNTNWQPYVVIALVAVILILSLPSINALYGGLQKEDWRGAADLIIENADAGNGVVCIPNYVHMPLDFYLNDSGVELVHVAVGNNASDIIAGITSMDICWVVVSSDVAYLPEVSLIEQWVINNVRPLMTQPFGLYLGVYVGLEPFELST